MRCQLVGIFLASILSQTTLLFLSRTATMHMDLPMFFVIPMPPFSDHITQLSCSCFMHIRDLCRIRPMLDLKTASTIATSIVHAKLDYCNSLFLNIDVTQINRLQD